MGDQDKLKEFIQGNLEEFNVEYPSDKVWTGIVAISKPKPFRYYIGIAASILLVVSVSTFFLFQETRVNGPDINTVAVEILEFELPEEVREIEKYYSQQVSQKISQAECFHEGKEMLEEVENLKLEFQDLKSDMGLGADRGRVLEAMIDNYRLRLMILEDLLEVLDNNTHKTLENEKDS